MQLGKYGQSASEDSFLKKRREAIREDLSKRLRHVCSHLSEQDFTKLVNAMADQKLKGERTKPL